MHHAEEFTPATTSTPAPEDVTKAADKNVKGIANKFAPRASTKTGKNPAQPGTLLYSIFDWQAWGCLVLGGFLSFNLLFPSDHPDIWRLMGCGTSSII